MLSQTQLSSCRTNVPTARTKVNKVLENTGKTYGDSSIFKNCHYSRDALSPLDFRWNLIKNQPWFCLEVSLWSACCFHASCVCLNDVQVANNYEFDLKFKNLQVFWVSMGGKGWRGCWDDEQELRRVVGCPAAGEPMHQWAMKLGSSSGQPGSSLEMECLFFNERQFIWLMVCFPPPMTFEKETRRFWDGLLKSLP